MDTVVSVAELERDGENYTRCINYDECENRVAGNGQICSPCLETARHKDATAEE